MDDLKNRERQVFTVSELNQDARTLLERAFPRIWVEGEISNFTAHGSGHWYFSLKDNKAQVSAAMFKMANRRLDFQPRAGDSVVVRGKISLYEPRGNYQLIIDHMEPAGAGALQRQFEELKAKLQQEGLFAEARKQALPEFPRCIGVITSPTGAAIRDILSVLRRRCPMIPVIVFPCLVQGAQAAPDIARAISRADQSGLCDVLIVARGGGSLEDLWAFNDESVARSIARCLTPVVSGVGHEVDFTICDFVADRRAPTPSVAAEMISPDSGKMSQRLGQLQQSLHRQMKYVITHKQDQLRQRAARLQHPAHRLQQQNQRVDELSDRLRAGQERLLHRLQQQLGLYQAGLLRFHPRQQLQQHQAELVHLSYRLKQAQTTLIKQAHNRLQLAAGQLQSVSPLATLARGYAIAKTADGDILYSASQVRKGEHISAQLKQGQIKCIVEQVDDS